MAFSPEICKELDDKEIVTRSLHNLDYFACIYIRYEKALLRYILRIAWVEEDDAHDILQESFIKIWKNLNEYDRSLSLSSWIYRIVHNETISCMRKKTSYGKHQKVDITDPAFEIPGDMGMSEEHEDKVGMTHVVLAEIPQKYRDVLILKFLEKKSYEEISDILKIPEGTVAIRINRAKNHFRKISGKRIFDNE